MKPVPIITFTTDFGTQDGYVGAMTGVIQRQCPNARVVTITHDVPPGDIRAGAWALGNAWPWFPPETIHVVVVDPGVGSERRGILVRARRQALIGPDNGVIPEAVRGTRIDTVREVANPVARAAAPNATFHGRDIFAWAAGWLTAGNQWRDVGPAIAPSDLVRLPDRLPRIERDRNRTAIVGNVLRADRFGNLITTVSGDLVARHIGKATPRVFVGNVEVPLGRTFSDVAPGDAVAYVGSSGVLEVAVSRGRAIERFGMLREITVVVRG